MAHHYHNQSDRNRRSNENRSRASRPLDDDDAFPGVALNPVEYDEVSAVTEVITTTSYMNNYAADEEASMERSRVESRRQTNPYYTEPNSRYNDGMHRVPQPDRDLDPYDEFCKKVFDAPTVAGDRLEEKERKKRGFRKGVIFGFLGLTVVVLGAFAVLFGMGILDVNGGSSSPQSSAAATSSSVTTNRSPTGAPVTTTTNELLPETSTPTDGPTNSPTQDPTPFPTPNPTTRPPTLPDTTSFPTEAPVTPSPTSSPTAAPVTPSPTTNPTDAPVTPSPTPNPTAAATTPETKEPTRSPSRAPTPPDVPVLTTEQPTAPITTTATERVTLRRIRIRMEEEAYSSHFTAPPGGIEKRINLSIVSNGEVYRSYSCYLLSSCDPFETLKLYQWLSFPDSSEWYMDGGFSPIFGNDGFERGPLELRIHVEDGDDYVWTVGATGWFQTAAGFETVNSRDINGNGPWMRWQFDTYDSSI